MDFSDELESHKAIHATLEELIAAIDTARQDHSKFKPEEMRALMTKLREPLVGDTPRNKLKWYSRMLTSTTS